MLQDKRKTRQQILMAKRMKRKPINSADVLTVNKSDKEDGYIYRFVNDVPGRVKKYMDGGYEPVEDKIETKTPQAGDASQLGSVVRTHVGDGTQAVLMRIEQELYDEDQAAIQAKTDKTAQAIYSVKGATLKDPSLPVTVGAGR